MFWCGSTLADIFMRNIMPLLISEFCKDFFPAWTSIACGEPQCEVTNPQKPYDTQNEGEMFIERSQQIGDNHKRELNKTQVNNRQLSKDYTFLANPKCPKCPKYLPMEIGNVLQLTGK